jgi:hypothetical protein
MLLYQRITVFNAQCEQNIINDKPLPPPALMGGHIDKFKGVPGRGWNGERITYLRQFGLFGLLKNI